MQARNATLSAAVALADAQIATLQPVVERTETEATAAEAAQRRNNAPLPGGSDCVFLWATKWVVLAKLHEVGLNLI